MFQLFWVIREAPYLLSLCSLNQCLWSLKKKWTNLGVQGGGELGNARKKTFIFSGTLHSEMNHFMFIHLSLN